MKNSRQHRNSISKANSQSILFALASALVFGAAMVATPLAQAQTYTQLYLSNGQVASQPHGELVLDRVGTLYGTTTSGGNGTVFELDTTGHAATVYTFNRTDEGGAAPLGTIVRYKGNIYGAASQGGLGYCSSGCGTIFELSGRNETVLHSFIGVPDGHYPVGGLARDDFGNLYGTASAGGSGTACGTQGCGIVFGVSHGQEKTLYSFAGAPDGSSPQGSLTVDSSGNLYGTTYSGGEFNLGSVFELSPNLDGTWTEHVLYSFPGRSSGREPEAGLIIDAKGSIYGTTKQGGQTKIPCIKGCGVVFRLQKNTDGTWAELVLHRFGVTADDGIVPVGNLVRDSNGNIYGTTSFGGAYGHGIVFKVSALGQETVLHAFAGLLNGNDGATPFAGLISDAAGNLYGTTLAGGLGFGTVFKITP